MKKVLQQLVESLFNMTNKINRMQNAIDYINSTFHERNESLKSVADTIAAMTESLNNFNANLNDINATLKGFKDFMKGLNNSVFNINDVLSYLDDSIINLDATVKHLDESVRDMNGTLLIINIRSEDINTSLKMINRTVIDVRDTTLSTNVTLNSMNKTLLKLNDIIFDFGRKLDDVINGLGGINVSLRNINDSVYNSYTRLGKLGQKIIIMNDTIENINSTMTRLNSSYNRIEEALQQMNESFTFLNGTILEELLDLSVLNDTLKSSSLNVKLIDQNKNIMNRSLSNALDWVKAMMDVVNSLNKSVERQNNTIIIGLEDKELLNTLNSLLSMNGSLTKTGEDVDNVNNNLSEMENKTALLEKNLKRVEESLAKMNVTLSFLNSLLVKVNETINSITNPLDAIHGTLQEVNKTANEIDASIDNVKQTLDAANMSKESIKHFASEAARSAESINNTISKVVRKTDFLLDSVGDFNSELDELSGSLPEMIQKIFNDNETIKIMKEEASILEDSLTIVSQKLKVLQATHKLMNDELNTTATALKNSDVHFSEIQNAIQSVNITLTGISKTLNGINDSLTELGLSFNNMSSAFPNINTKIQSIMSMTNNLLKITKAFAIKNSKSHINEGKASFMATDIAEDLLELQEQMRNLGNFFGEVNFGNTEATYKLGKLFRLIEDAEQEFDVKFSMVALLDGSFDKLLEKYNVLEEKSAAATEYFYKPKEKIDSLEKRLETFRVLLRKYRRLDDDLHIKTENLNITRNDLLDSNTLLNKSFTLFKSKNNSVWYENGHPKLNNLTFIELQEKIFSLNLTMNDHDQAIKKAYNTIGKVTRFSNDLDAKLDTLNETMRKFDLIQYRRSLIDNNLLPLTEKYDEKSDEVENTIDGFDYILGELDRIKSAYGNVNGTYNSTHVYGEIQRSLIGSLETVNSLKDDIENKKKLLNITQENYSLMLKDFNNTNFGITADSGAFLDELLDKLGDTVMVLDDLNDSWIMLNNSVSLENMILEEARRNLGHLESELQAQMHKNKYVSMYSKIIESELEAIPFTIDDIMATVQHRNDTIMLLTNYISELQRNASVFSTMNMTFTEESRNLNETTTTLEQTLRRLQEANYLYHDTLHNYEHFDTHNASLNDIKFQYQNYLRSLQNLKEEAANSHKELDVMGSDLEAMRNSLLNITAWMNAYASLITYFNETGNMLENVTETVQSVQDLFMTGLIKFKDMHAYFHELENSYANISSVALKASAKYIRDLLLIKQQNLDHINASVFNINKLHNSTSLDYKEVNESLSNTTITRNNIMKNILTTNAFIDHIQSNLYLLLDELNKLNLEMTKINDSLLDMDEVLHERNAKLFIKRQKKLYVTEKLPDLLELYSKVNKLLATAEKERVSILGDTILLQNMTDDVTKLQDAFGNMNIPMTATEEELQAVYNFAEEIGDTIRTLNESYGQINKSLVSNNAWDSLKDDSFESTKFRFEETLDILDNITVSVNKITTDTENNKKELNWQRYLLENLTTLIEDFKGLNAKSVLYKEWSNEAEERSFNFDNKIKRIEKEVNDFRQYLSSLNTVYENLDERFLNKTMSYPTNQLKLIDASIPSLLKEHKISSDIKLKMRHTLNEMEVKLLTNISSYNTLQMLSNQIHTLHDGQKKLMSNVSLYYGNLSNQISNLERKIDELKDQLALAETYLMRQQKTEYIETNLPRLQNLQSDLEERIHNATTSMDSVGILHNYISSLYNSTKSLIENHPKLMNISTNGTHLRLKSINTMFKNNSDWLSVISYESKTLQLNLTKDQYIDKLTNLTIDDLQFNFGLINSSLHSFEKQLDYIENNDQSMYDDLEDIEFYFGQLDQWIDSINSFAGHSDGIINDWVIYDKNLTNLRNSVKNTAVTLANITNTVHDLNESYSHIKDPDLQNNLSYTNRIIQDIHDDLEILVQSIVDMEKNNNMISHNVELLKKLKTSPVTSIEGLKTDMNEMATLALKIKNSTINGLKVFNKTDSQLNDLLLKLINLQNRSDNLQRELKRQEKIEFLESVLPSIEKKKDSIGNDLRDTNSTINDARDYVVKNRENLFALRLRLNHTDKTNISLTDIEGKYNRTEERIKALITNLNNDKRSLGTLNIYRLLNDTLITNDTFSLAYLKQYVSKINKDLDDTWSSVNDTKDDADEISQELTYLNARVIDLQNDLKKLTKLENDVIESENELLHLQRTRSKAVSELEIISTYLQKLNGSLQEVLSDMNSVNNSLLAERIRRYRTKLETDIQKTDDLDHLLKREKIVLTNATDKLNILNVLLDDVAYDHQHLKAKLKNGSSLLEILKEENRNLSENLSDINEILPLIDTDMLNLKSEFQDIRTDVERQKIKNFIKHNFPDLLESYSAVNSSLLSQTEVVQDLELAVYVLQNRTELVEDLLFKYEPLNITLDSIWSDSEHMLFTLGQAKDSLGNLSDTFDSIGLSLIEDAEINETVEEVKERFSEKLQLLLNLHEVINNLTAPMEDVKKKLLMYNNELSRNNSTIISFESMQGYLTSQNPFYDYLNQTSKLVFDVLNNNSKRIISLFENLQNTQQRYANVSDINLHIAREDIQQFIKKENNTLMHLNQLFDAIFKDFADQQKMFLLNKNLLNSSVKSFKSLKTNLDSISNATIVLLDRSSQTERDFNNIAEKLANQTRVISKLQRDIFVLKEKYKEKEKHDFLNAYLPVLNSFIKQIKKSLNDTEKSVAAGHYNVSQTTNLFTILKDKISSAPFLNITIKATRLQIEGITDSMQATENDLKKSRKDFINLNISTVLDPRAVLQVSLGTLQATFASLNNSLIEIKSNLLTVAQSLKQIEDGSNSSQSFLNDTFDLIEEYHNLVDSAASLEKELNLTNTKIKSTASLYGEVEHMLKKQISELNNSLLKQDYISNDTKNMIKDVSNRTDKITRQLSIMKKGFNESIFEANIENKEQFVATESLLNNTFSSVSDLQDAVELVTTFLHNVSDTNNEIDNKIIPYNEEASHMYQQLQQANELFLRIKELLRLENKESFVQKAFPTFLQKYKELNFSLNDVLQVLALSNASLHNISKQVETTNVKIDAIPHIYNLTNNQSQQINILREELANLYHNVTSSANIFASFNLSALNDRQHVLNDTVTLEEIQNTYDQYNNSFGSLETTVATVLDRNFELELKLSKLKHQLNKLDGMLLLFSTLEDGLLSASRDITDLHRNKSIITIIVEKAGDDLQKLNDTFVQLKENYEEFVGNTSAEEKFITQTRMKIDKLYLLLNDANIKLAQISNEQQNTNITFYRPIYTTEVFENTLGTVRSELISTGNNIKEYAERLQKIADDIPIVESDLRTVIESVKDLEWMLSNQQNKSNILRLIRPLTQHKLISVSSIFERTNFSIQNATDYARVTEKAINALKNRLDSIPTINITVADMEQNITDIIDNLTTISNKYNLLKRSFKTLKNEIISFNVLNENLTVEDVERKYSAFNITLNDMVNVLDELQTKTSGLDPQLAALNNKVANVNDVMDKFILDDSEIASLGGQLYDIQGSLNKAEEDIEQLRMHMIPINETFELMKDSFFEVINQTTENVSQVREVLQKVNDFLIRATSRIQSLSSLLNDSKLDLATGYNDLHEYLDTYDGLTKLVDDIFKMNGEVRGRLNIVKNETQQLNNETRFFNSSFKDIPSKLNILKKILNKEQKMKYISDVFPQYQTRSEYLNISIESTLKTLIASREKLLEVSNKIQLTNKTIQLIPSVNITMDPYHQELVSFRIILDGLFTQATDALDTYKTLDSSAWAGQDIIQNNTITLKILQNNYARSKQILNETRTILESVEANNEILSSGINGSLDTLSQILQLLTTFDDVNSTFSLVTKQIPAARSNKTYVDMRMDTAKDILKGFHASLIELQTDYIGFRFNNSSEMHLINALYDTFIHLDNKLNESESQLLQIEALHRSTKETLYEKTDDIARLKKILNTVQGDTITINKDIRNFAFLLHEILTEIPSIDANILKIGDALVQLTNILNHHENTTNLLDEANGNLMRLRAAVFYVNESLASLKGKYSDVMNKTRDNATKIEITIHNVDHFLTTALTLLENLKSLLNDSKLDIISSNDTSGPDLSPDETIIKIVKDVSIRNNAVREKLEIVQNKTSKINNETYVFDILLMKMPQALDNLRNMLNKEQKKEYIESSFPKYQAQYVNLNITLHDTMEMLNASRQLLNKTSDQLQMVSTKISEIPTVNISKDPYQEELSDLNSTLNELIVQVTNALNRFRALDAEVLFGQSLVENETITLKILKRNYINSKQILNEADVALDAVETSNENLTSAIIDIRKSLLHLSEILNTFKDIDHSFNLVSQRIPIARSNKSDVDIRMNSVKTEVLRLNATVFQLETDYNEFQYNSSLEKQTINALYEDIVQVEIQLLDASTQLQQIETFNRSIHNNLYKIMDNDTLLNNTLIRTHNDIIIMKNEIRRFALLLQQILEKIPKLELNINKTDGAVLEMKRQLISQKNKATFEHDAKPALQDRLDNTTSEFQRTNLSLELMHQQIQNLQDYVDSVKARLDGLPTVNISLAEIDTNITEMENRLIIMQDYYNNVREVISQLHDNVDTFDIFKENLTLNNVEQRYKMFNNTLDDVDAVLGKIGREFDSFGSQFTNINKSLGNIDHAIGRFEEKTQKIKVLEKDVHNFGYSLDDTNRHVDNMISVIRHLNHSFISLKQNYSDVINRTSEKNTNIEQKINKIDSNLKGIKNSIDSVVKLYSVSQSNVSMINQSLFKDIHTFEDLNTTLSDVKRAYSIIRSQLREMKNIIKLKSNETNGFNSTLTGISSVLDDLKLMLDEEQKDHAKEQFINTHLDQIRNQFTALHSPLQKTKSSIANQSQDIGDVDLLAKKTGNRLNRFRTIDITTNTEKKKINKLKSAMNQLNKNVSATDNTIIEVRDLIASLENRNESLDGIKTKFELVNSTLNDLNTAIADINNILARAKNETSETRESLLKFESSMNTFKSVQRNLGRLRNLMKVLNARTAEAQTDLGSTDATLNKLEKIIKATNLMHKILDDPEYKLFQPSAVSNLTAFNISHTNLGKESSEIGTKLDHARHSLDKLSRSVKKILTRENIDQAIPDLQEQLTNISSAITELQIPAEDLNRKTNVLHAGVQKFEKDIEMMKDVLTLELDKYEYVKDSLPYLQRKYRSINQSLEKNRPAMENVKSKLVHMKEVMVKIKEKMKIFGVDDTDGTVQQWEKNIMKMEAAISETAKKHSGYARTIINMKEDLFKDIKAMFTKSDTLNDVKSKLGNFNKTLNGIEVSVDSVAKSLKDLDISANDIGQDLVDRNMILTTTPPTTTPSGAPDWLNFSSSGGGVIGRDSATLRCQVEDLTMWHMMKIEKVAESGNKVVMAAWKLGAGFRKTVRDRRIRVKKEEDGVSGALTVTINRLRCEDEATYLCSIDSYHMWPVQASLAVSSLPEDSLVSSFPTEVFEDKTATFACTGYPGYPDGEITWRIRHENETEFYDYEFYSQISNVSDDNCRRKEINSVPFQFDMSWNNTFVRCYISNTDYYAEGQIRLLPYDICNNVRYLGTIAHPYTPHKYIVCGKELNIMQCAGNTCYDVAEHNCVQCKADHRKGDPCLGQPLYSYVAHETDCKKYYICMGPTKSTKKCTRGYFSPRVPGYCVLAYSQSECARNQKK